MKFGENLYNLRKNKKISQEVLAGKVGVSRQSVSKWETGESYPEMDNIMKLCNIFHCKINDIVHTDMKDIDSLNEEIKMNVVKLEEKKQNKMKVLSKLIYTISKTGKICTLIGACFVMIAAIIIPVILLNVKVINNNEIKIFNSVAKYESADELYYIDFAGSSLISIDKKNMDYVIENIENGTVGTIIFLALSSFTKLFIFLIILFYLLKYIEKLFINIFNCNTPFLMENVKYIKTIAKLMIALLIIPNLIGLICGFFVDADLGIEIETIDIIYILVIYVISYVFEYGYEIQKDSNGIIYNDNINK